MIVTSTVEIDLFILKHLTVIITTNRFCSVDFGSGSKTSISTNPNRYVTGNIRNQVSILKNLRIYTQMKQSVTVLRVLCHVELGNLYACCFRTCVAVQKDLFMVCDAYNTVSFCAVSPVKIFAMDRLLMCAFWLPHNYELKILFRHSLSAFLLGGRRGTLFWALMNFIRTQTEAIFCALSSSAK